MSVASVLGVAATALLAVVGYVGPNEGETRAITRDAEQLSTTVAGEADGAATVNNPGNLGFLRALNAVFDVGWTIPGARRRGSGAGAFFGVPLPRASRASRLGFRGPLATLGVGVQYLHPVQPDAGQSEQASPSQVDDPHAKLTLAAAVPLTRWARGLSVGLAYSRLISVGNFHANANVLDVGLGWHASRFLALGVVARAVNVPRTGPQTSVDVTVTEAAPDTTVVATGNRYAQPFIVEPELALRPLGTQALELAAGMRWAPALPNDGPARFETFVAEPRGRISVKLGPLRIFTGVELMRFLPLQGEPNVDARAAARLHAGIEVVDANFSAAAGVLGSANGRRGFAVDGGVARLRLSAERYRGLDLAPRRVTKFQLSRTRSERELWQLVGEIETVARAGGVMLVETRGTRLGWAQAEEVRAALRRARLQGARVFAYVEGGGLRDYFIATAADTIVAHPTTALATLGLQVQTLFFAELFAKLGAKAEFVRIAEYKATPETYARTGPSSVVDAQRRMLAGDLWNHVVGVVARARGQSPQTVKRWVDEAPLAPGDARQHGMVDQLAYPDELDARLEAVLGRKVRIERPPRPDLHVHDYGPRPQVAVVRVEGDLAEGPSLTVPVIGKRVVGAATLSKTIERVRNDPLIRAVVVRIDSPGGSVKAAEDIARELELTDAVKPVVISMGNRCASGGYYLASAGRFIYGDAMTVTGSIGVFYPKIDLSGALAKLGIAVDHVTYGAHAALRSWLRPYTAEDRATVRRELERSYARFVGRVGQARRMTTERVDKVARGRVWSGARARQVGLVDRIGGLRDAIDRARAIAGLTQRRSEVVWSPAEPSVASNLRQLLSVQLPRLGRSRATPVPAPTVAGVDALRWLPAFVWLRDQTGVLAMDEAIMVVRH